MKLTNYPGHIFPLGATWDGKGVNFSIYSQYANAVELCLFDSESRNETHRIKMTERTGHIWHTYIPDIEPGQLYAYRFDGPYEPENGHRFNKNKLLIDPNAKALSGKIDWDDALFSYEVGHPDEDLSFDERDSAPFLPKGIVIDPHFDWGDDRHPDTPLHKTIIYEMHVKGFSQMHPDIPEAIRGTYAAIAHPVSIQYLKDLGITAIELLPIHHFVSDRHLLEKGLTNYWGYNTLAFFAPDVRYSGSGVMGQQVTEFKNMVKELHKAGIEVLLDVVYNHTAEGNHLGPTLSLKGIDNSCYYRLSEEKRYYKDFTGTGNTLNTMESEVLRLIMDSLRYWIQEMHVDGFRFDLASALVRGLHEVDRLASFFDIIYQDPVISRVKLIAEPWDVGDSGYQVGNFPQEWSEWNGKYRDTIRDYWRGADSMLGEFAERFTGSSDLYKGDYRTPVASINFITAHDGFTLEDLVSYNEKHNEANLEDNTDGADDNRSWNCGAEGPTEDETVLKLRRKQKRNLLVTLFLSQGVPMLLAGDELGRTQSGNNNGYCQDNELSWINWSNKDEALLEFTKYLISIRKSHPIFRKRGWFQGYPIRGTGVEDIAWFQPGGEEMSEEHWSHDFAKSLAVYLNGKGIHALGVHGEQIVDDNFYLLFNAHHEDLDYKLPEAKYGNDWVCMLDTDREDQRFEETPHYKPGEIINVKGRSIIVLQNHRE